jgi:hypothetical protein
MRKVKLKDFLILAIVVFIGLINVSNSLAQLRTEFDNNSSSSSLANSSFTNNLLGQAPQMNFSKVLPITKTIVVEDGAFISQKNELYRQAIQEAYDAGADKVKLVDSKGNIIWQGTNEINIVDQAINTLDSLNQQAVASFIDSTNSSKCCKNGICRIQENQEFSCNLVENSIVEDNVNAEVHKILSLVKFQTDIATNENNVKGNREFCEKCFQEVYQTSAEEDKNKSFEDLKADVLEKVRYIQFRREVDEMVNAHEDLRIFYKHHKESIERSLKKGAQKTKKTPGVFGINMLSDEMLINMKREKLLCLTFKEVSYGLSRPDSYEDSFVMGGDAFVSDDLAPEKTECAQRAESLFKGYALERSGFKIQSADIGDLEKDGESLNKLFVAYADKLLDSRGELNEKQIKFVESFYADLPNNLERSHNDLKKICQEEGNTTSREMEILMVLFKDVFNESNPSENLGKAVRLSKALSYVDPNLTPFFYDSTGLCSLVANHSAEDIGGMDYKSYIRMSSFPDQESKDAEVMERLESLSAATCKDKSNEIVRIACNDEVNKNDLKNLNASKLTNPEKIALASLQCRLPVEQEQASQEADELRDQALASAKAASNDVRENGRSALVDQIIEQEVAASAKGSRRDSENRNFVSRMDEIVLPNDLDIPSYGKESVIESNNSSASSSIPVSSIGGQIGAESGDMSSSSVGQGPNSFQRRFEELMQESSSLMNSGSNHNFSQTSQNLINNRPLSQSEIDQSIQNDQALNSSFEQLESQLRSQLAQGQDSADEKLKNVLAEKDKITASDLKGSELEKQRLLEEIENLKKQVAASVKNERSKTAEDATDKRISELEKELARYKKLATAKTSPSSRSTASLGASNQRVLDNANASSGRTSSSAQSSASTMNQSTLSLNSQNIMTSIPPTIQQDPAKFIKAQDFSLGLRNNRLVLTVKEKGLDRFPVEVDDIILDTSGEIRQVIIGNSAPIDISLLSQDSREALEKYIDQEKRSGSQRISQIQREIARTKELKKSAHESSVRYQQFLCSLNSSASGCAQ